MPTAPRARPTSATARSRPSGGETWRYRGPTPDPYQVEHDDLFASIRAGNPINEAEAGAKSTMTAILGRMCTYSGKEITWDEAINSKINLAARRILVRRHAQIVARCQRAVSVAGAGVDESRVTTARSRVATESPIAAG